MTVTYRPPEMRLSITQGLSFHRELPVAYDRVEIDDDGNPVPFNFTGWTARLDLYDAEETLILSFATSGEDGVITLGSTGATDLDLADTVTNALPATVEVAGVIHAAIYGHLNYTSPGGTSYEGARVVAEIVRSPEP